MKNDDTSVFFDTFEPLPEPKDAEALLAKWERIRAIRADAQVAIEEERTKGTVGSSLQAVGTIRATPADYELLASLGEELRFVMIMSAVELVKAEGDKTTIEVRASDAKKCERCWHYVADVGSVAEHPTLCPRAVAGNGSVGDYLIFRCVSVILPRQRTRSHDRRAVHHSLYRGVCFCRITRPTFGIATTTIGVKF